MCLQISKKASHKRVAVHNVNSEIDGVIKLDAMNTLFYDTKSEYWIIEYYLSKYGQA